MVGTIKRWLGIDVLERENLTLAKALKAAHRRIDAERKESAELIVSNQKDFLALQGRVARLEEQLTSDPPKPKIVSKSAAPKRVNWRQARAALEKASEPQEESA